MTVTLTGILAGILITLTGILMSINLYQAPEPLFGSVQAGGEYNFTAITGTATSTAKTLPGTLGSIVVESVSSAGGFVAFYATTSAATTSADLLLNFDGTALEGTYTYDINFANGLLIDPGGGFDGDLIVTYR